MILLSQSTYVPGSWAGGTTSGIWADPADAITSPSAARCWVGTAVIERDARYSVFVGRHRLHLPIHGQGLRLKFRDPWHEVALACGESYQFDGERPVEAELAAGPVVAFNLIYRADGIADATVATIGPSGLRWALAPIAGGSVTDERVPLAIIYCIAGTLAISAGADQQVTLDRDDTLIIPPVGCQDASPPLFLTSTGSASAEVILATLRLRTGVSA